MTPDTFRLRSSAAERPAGSDAMLRDVLAGLQPDVRKLPPKYFYDDIGARLFEEICELDEYYPTRTELAILQRHAPEIGDAVGPRARIVEPGSGSGLKTRLLLRHLKEPVAYAPIDIAEAQLFRFAQDLREEFPFLEIQPVAADYTGHVDLPPASGADRTVAFFPGSTLGNFEPAGAEAFLRRLRRLCGTRGGLILGTDMHKDVNVLHAAYNDACGVTAAFNLNLLTRFNRELGADFDVSAFAHSAVYDSERHRIEMRLICVRDCVVRIPLPGGGTALFSFEAGEHITTEYSHKYTRDGIHELGARTGWRVERGWTDARGWFTVWLMRSEACTPG